MGKKSFNQLLLEGQIPTDLIKRVEKKTGVNPLSIAAVQYKHERQESFLNNAFWVCFAVAFLFTIYFTGAGGFRSFDEVSAVYALSILLTLLFALTICLEWVRKRNKRQFEKLFPNHTFNFEDYYRMLLEWGNVTKLNEWSEYMIRSLVHAVVLNAATRLIKVERAVDRAREVDELESSEESGKNVISLEEEQIALKQAFYNAHVEALTLGYVPSDRNEFRREAEAEIRNEEKSGGARIDSKC